MAKLKVTRTTGDIQEFEITPKIEYQFEQWKKKGIHRAFREDESQTDVYYLVWLAIKDSGEVVKVFGEDFLATLRNVEVLDSDPL